MKPGAHVLGVDDAPFPPSYRGNVLVVGALFAGARLENVLSTRVRRDGADATRRIAEMVQRARCAAHLQVIMLQGIALAGFNVVDLQALHAQLGIPVLTVARRPPDLEAMHSALLNHVRGGKRKWRLLVAAGPMEQAGGVWIQRAGISLREARALIERLAVNGALPEPLRTAHLIAGGVSTGESRHRP